MSYILEALKKDEAASDPAAAASLALAQSTPKQSWALWALGIALLINAAVLGYLFFPRGDDSGAAQNRSSQPLSQPQASRDVVVRPRQRVAPPGQQSQRDAAPIAAPRQRPARPARPSGAPASAREAPEIAAAPAAAAPSAAAPGGGRVLSPEEATALNLLPPETAAVDTPTAQAGETVIAPGQRSTPTPKPASDDRSGRVIQLAELPPSDRQDFPKLEFSTHIFADDPALRAVVVNSRRLNEGQSIGEMVLRAVTEDGILVDYRGYRVAVSVIEEWN